jgi:nucleotide-binding universal stress UspA family protein
MDGERYIGVALDYSKSSIYSLQWTVENILRKGDQLIVIVVNRDMVLEGGQGHLWEQSGSPLIPLQETQEPGVRSHYQLKDDEEVEKALQEAAVSKKATVLYKVYWGDAKEKICTAVSDAPITLLVMGCRGLGALKRTFMGSVSNYVSNNVNCPVTIVKLPANVSAS